ncbi:MAG TPA: endonuclease/exonuclease/phosphatase family protein [Candidatus Nanoarchaeia archaeon]|nr:endonuclease/exonuclease/phosphatase family protein [Candidatus Nanoarchaeia archaeon]
MRLITLNTWSGRALYPLMDFFRRYKYQADIFCLQEVRNSSQEVAELRHPDEHLYGPLFNKISSQLSGFEGSFAYFPEDPDKMSLASFWHRDLPLKTVDDFVVYTPEKPQETGSTVFSARKLQYLMVNLGGLSKKDLLIVNYHGLWNGGAKTDTPERITQSEKIKEFMNLYDGPKILCGDFNLLPETESMRILEEGMRNLVTEYGIQSTRTPLYRHYGQKDHSNFADYVFISPGIVVKEFKILPDIASDHAGLYLEFDVQ